MMDPARDSDLSQTQMDLVDSSSADAFGLSLPIEGDSMHAIKGFCVKEYEEEMQDLKKENFNLKLKIFMLEEKNPNIPEGAEGLYKQNIDLKIERETLLRDVQEKQHLLFQASKAMDLLDKQKGDELERSQFVIDELNQKIESLEHEVSSLQNALADSNKSTFANDTGYADFLGAVDPKEIECQRKMKELIEIEVNFRQQINAMNEKVKELQAEKKEIEMKASQLLYDNDEMKDRMSQVEKHMVDQLSRLETELTSYKQKWAESQCDLQDTESRIQASEREREKAYALFEKTLKALESERMKINDLENHVAESFVAANQSSSKHDSGMANEQRKLLMMKESEINELKNELLHAKRQVQTLSHQDLSEKNREIEKLSNLVKNLQLGRDSMTSQTRMSLEQLSESFNELKFQQAMEEKKKSQEKINQLINDLVNVSNSRTKEHFGELQTQMAIVVEKQEVTDVALGKCADICVCTLDHLHELALFLKAILQQKEIKESMSEMTMINFQNVLESTMEFSNQATRYSVDGRMSLPDISSLDILMTTARNSIATIREIQSANKSIQASYDEEKEFEFQTLRKEMEDINRVNQLLEDEICQLKQSMENYLKKITVSTDEIEELKIEKDSLNFQLKEALTEAEVLASTCEDLENTLKAETIKKFQFESKLMSSENLAAKLQEKLETVSKDIEDNWITKNAHDFDVQRLKDDIVNGEAQVAAIRMEMDSLRANATELSVQGMNSEMDAFKSEDVKQEKENFKPVPARRTLEISEDRKLLLEATSDSTVSVVSSTSDNQCPNCPKYQARVAELKKYLGRAMDKLKFQSEMKAVNDRHIQNQLANTEKFLSNARSNMENVLKVRNKSDD